MEQQGRERAAVEVYFDGAGEAIADLPGVKVRVALKPGEADEAVINRAALCAYRHKRCVVVSNDHELRQAAQEAGAEVLSASDFVSRPDAALDALRAVERRPARRPPPARATSFPRAARWLEALEKARRRSEMGKPARQQAERAVRTPPGGSRTWDEAIQAAQAAPQATRRPGDEAQPDDASSSPATPQDLSAVQAEPAPPSGCEIRSTSLQPEVDLPPAIIDGTANESDRSADCYRISLETWPVAAGRRFLIDSLCPTHRAEMADFLAAFDEQASHAPICRRWLRSCWTRAVGSRISSATAA